LRRFLTANATPEHYTLTVAWEGSTRKIEFEFELDFLDDGAHFAAKSRRSSDSRSFSCELKKTPWSLARAKRE